MIGRGAIRQPTLAQQIRGNQTATSEWRVIVPLLQQFWHEISAALPPRNCVGRVKQWTNYLREIHPEAEILWRSIREQKSAAAMAALLAQLH
jgi:tRNA-dihydrouridine synthase C